MSAHTCTLYYKVRYHVDLLTTGSMVQLHDDASFIWMNHSINRIFIFLTIIERPQLRIIQKNHWINRKTKKDKPQWHTHHNHRHSPATHPHTHNHNHSSTAFLLTTSYHRKHEKEFIVWKRERKCDSWKRRSHIHICYLVGLVWEVSNGLWIGMDYE